MKILFVAMSESIHAARWISQIADQGWELHLFSSHDTGLIHAEFKNITMHVPIYGVRKVDSSVKVRGLSLRSDFLATGVNLAMGKLDGHFERQSQRLARLIRKLKPDIVHSLEIQHSGYLTMAAKKLVKGPFPRWIVTNWGSDIYLFGRLPEHQPKIREVLESCDFYSCECQRDVTLAQRHGLRGKALPVMPCTGGFDLDAISRLRDPTPPSLRRVIMLKGYQSWAGRALVGLRALERCADLLKGYRLVIYGPVPDVELAAKLFAQSTGVPVEIIPWGSPHEQILRLHGQARISIGMSISDAISTSLLEALVMGSFPIQSATACADEWVENGKTALLTPPEDPEVVADAIRRALTDDVLVDAASAANWKTAEARLAKKTLKQKALALYDTVIK